LTENILGKRELEYFVKDWKLIPSTGGRYEFEVNGELIFSKKGLGRHAEEG
jgi:predicted Rdx family selenoprotein